MKKQVMEIPKVVEILNDMTTKYPTNSYPHRRNIHERYAGEIYQLFESQIQQAKDEVAREILQLVIDYETIHTDEFEVKYGKQTNSYGLHTKGLPKIIEDYFKIGNPSKINSKGG